MKVAVYTIALNEAANAQRWADSAADADYRIVADTGSSDDTVERLTRAGVTVHQIAIRPWRFDDARNAAMALIPDDVDVCCHHGHGLLARPRLAPAAGSGLDTGDDGAVLPVGIVPVERQ